MSDVGFPGVDGLIKLGATVVVLALAAIVAGVVIFVRARRRGR